MKQLPNVSTAHGAPMGRANRNILADAAGLVFTVESVPLDKGGYDSGGAYWGLDVPLWNAVADDPDGVNDPSIFLRAPNRADAVAQVAKMFPGCTFDAAYPLDTFVAAYLEAALWSSHDDDGEPLDRKHEVMDCATELVESARADCEKFVAAARADLDAAEAQDPTYDASRAGHDFWLTHNGHGAGFWCRNLGDIGDRLTEASKAFPEIDLYVGDDGKIYGS